MTPSCPSDLALEAHLLEPAASALGTHLSSCADCAARLAAMERQGEDFRRFVYPATVARIEEAARHRGWRLWVLAPVPVFAAAALAVVLLRPVSNGTGVPADGYTGLKGAPGGLGLTVFTRGAVDARPVPDGAHLSARAAVRFRVRNAEPCRLVVFSIDAAGQVSRLHPLEGGPAELPAGTHDVPAGAVLDGKGGPERFHAVCARALPWQEIEALARASAAGGADAVRRGEALPGAAAGLPQASVLVEKDTP